MNTLVTKSNHIFEESSREIDVDKDTRIFDNLSREVDVYKDTRIFDNLSREIDSIIEKLNTVSRNLQLHNHLEKHKKYLKLYKSNELFWGLGIENEFYLEFETRPKISRDFFINNHLRERYSVNYYSNYDVNLKNDAFEKTNHLDVDIPYLINSHSFTDTDKNNNHKTLEKSKARVVNSKTRAINDKAIINPDYSGKTLGEEIFESNTYLKNNFNKTWLYDGDTFEITTLNFYKTNIFEMIKELDLYKNEFIENIQKYQEETNLFSELGKIKIMEKNYPFAIHVTNLNNIGIFNNGTLHYNLTLPTELDNNMLIKDPVKFKEEHKKAIRIIQLFEPLLICIYGTTDYFSQLNWENANKFSAVSQRSAVSRYIGLGTYDTDVMTDGKILLTELSNYPDYFWYNKYHKNSAYNKLEKIGLDINYNKHYNHGIEIRFLDHLSSRELIFESFEFIIYLFDLILDRDFDLENPVKTTLWNDLVCNVMTYGKNYSMAYNELKYFEKVLKINIEKINIVEVYYEIFSKLKTNFSINFNGKNISVGKFSRLVLMQEKFCINYPEKLDENHLEFKTNEILDLKKFSNEIEHFTDISNLPKEIFNIIEIVDAFDEINEYLSSLIEISAVMNEKSLKILSDINQIIKTAIDVINYNIEKVLENKNNIDTNMFNQIMNLIRCFKIA